MSHLEWLYRAQDKDIDNNNNVNYNEDCDKYNDWWKRQQKDD